MPQLDSLRALAVFAVFATHFTAIDQGSRPEFALGNLGVKLFFVLSGFLIATILLDCRVAVAEKRTTNAYALWNFYIRRFLRLMPIYLIYLGFGALFLPGFSQHLLWFLAYAANFFFAIHPEAFAVYMPHFWTLAIEEQFYLLMPLVLLTVPTRYLLLVAVTTVAIGPVFRAAGLLAGFTSFQIGMMLPAQLDTLGMGVLLAVVRHLGDKTGQVRSLFDRHAWMVGAVLLAVLSLVPLPEVRFVGMNLALGFLFCGIIAAASVGYRGWVGKVLELAPLVYLGRISYGLYVYHFNVSGALREKVFPPLGLTMPESPVLRFLLFTITSIAIASISWYLIESRIIGLKRYFPYLKKRDEKPSATV